MFLLATRRRCCVMACGLVGLLGLRIYERRRWPRRCPESELGIGVCERQATERVDPLRSGINGKFRAACWMDFCLGTRWELGWAGLLGYEIVVCFFFGKNSNLHSQLLSPSMFTKHDKTWHSL